MDSSDTSSTLASGNFLGIINVLMQLRKVRCTRPPGDSSEHAYFRWFT